jgi:aryl-alcohol dehydrogenase-like predicted oxidoreductase
VKRAEDYPATDFRHGDPRFQGGNFDANVCAAQVVQDIAADHGAKAGQVAIAWLPHKGDDIVPIPGTKRRSYLQDNIDAARLRLAPGEIARLDEALDPSRVSGPRYTEANMALVDR